MQALKHGSTLPRPFALQQKQLVIHDRILFRKVRFQIDEPEMMHLVLPWSLCYPVFQQLHDNAGFTKHKQKFKKESIGLATLMTSNNGSRIVTSASNAIPHLPREPPLQQPNHMRRLRGTLWDHSQHVTRNKYILVITDLFTKWVEVFPLKETTCSRNSSTGFGKRVHLSFWGS